MRWFLFGLFWLLSVVGAYFLGSYLPFRGTITPNPQHGRFLSTPKAEWLANGRDMRLIEDFVYVDPSNLAWLAPVDSVVNGASIPQPFWSVMGGPFSGKYRNASIVHDVACVEQSKHSDAGHRMFYDACLAGGVPDEKAKLLYWAVAKFGPKWQSETRVRTTIQSLPNGESIEVESAYPVSVPIESPEATEEDVQWALEYFAEHDLEADQIPPLEREPVE